MKERLRNKVILVTGGGAGLGEASARAFAVAGATVVVSDVDVDNGRNTVEKIKENGGKATFIKTDVSFASEVKALVEEIVNIHGKLDCALNNAGIRGIIDPTHECTEENWDNVININLKGIWLCMKYEISQMLRNSHGAIVNMSSAAGLVGFYNHPAYIASKHGIIGLTKAAALEYAKSGIRINALCPGPIRTPMLQNLIRKKPEVEQDRIAKVPMGCLGTPDEVAEAATWFCSDASSYITGAFLAVDGGYIGQ